MSIEPGKSGTAAFRRPVGLSLKRFSKKLGVCVAGLLLLGTLAAFGCSQGSYPVDIFYEMHYQQSYKAQEPPSLSAPASSVAWYPPPQSTAFSSGQHLYTVNCSMCHGDGAWGDGPVVLMLKENYGYKPVIDPPDLTDNPIDNIVFTIGSDTRVFGPASVMPPFGKLLSEAEQLAIAEYVDSLPPSPQVAAPVEEPAAPASEKPTASPDAMVVSVKGDSLEFDTAALEVESGSEVVLFLDNVSTLYEHNLVIVEQGQKDAVSERGAVAGLDNGWLQPDDPDVIGGVPMIGPGGAGEARFPAPPAGTYQFVCTFPGHNATMFGDFVVSP